MAVSPFLGLRHGGSSSSIHFSSSFLAPRSKHYLNTLSYTQREEFLLCLSHYLPGQFLLIFQNCTCALVWLCTFSVTISPMGHRSCFELSRSFCTFSFHTLHVCSMSTEGVLAQIYQVQCRQGPSPSCTPE